MGRPKIRNKRIAKGVRFDPEVLRVLKELAKTRRVVDAEGKTLRFGAIVNAACRALVKKYGFLRDAA